MMSMMTGAAGPGADGCGGAEAGGTGTGAEAASREAPRIPEPVRPRVGRGGARRAGRAQRARWPQPWVWLGALTVLGWPAAPAGAQTPLGDPMRIAVVRDFLPRDGAGSRHPDAPAELEQLGRLAGVWIARQEVRRRDGAWVEGGPALWVWRYALGGFAVQDLWYQAADRLPAYLGELGRDYLLSGFRSYDPEAERWHVAWTANGLGRTPGLDFGTMEGRREGERLVLRSPGDGENPQRIVFSEISDDGFLWESEFSQDGGKTWIVVMRVRAERYR